MKTRLLEKKRQNTFYADEDGNTEVVGGGGG